jgi:hypothetical protein
MRKLKRKTSSTPEPAELEASTKKRTMQVDEISPTSKVTIFKVDVLSCNGNDLKSTELSAADLENLWTDGFIRELSDLSGYSSSKVKGGTEIRIQYQLTKPLSIRDIAIEAEFDFDRTGPKGVEVLRCRVCGLHDLRPANIGETIKVKVLATNFDIPPEHVIEWLAKYGIVHGHR